MTIYKNQESGMTAKHTFGGKSFFQKINIKYQQSIIAGIYFRDFVNPLYVLTEIFSNGRCSGLRFQLDFSPAVTFYLHSVVK